MRELLNQLLAGRGPRGGLLIVVPVVADDLEQRTKRPDVPEEVYARDRALVVSVCHSGGRVRERLTEDQRADLDALAWRLQDGYGRPGFTPPQGWDWSGIRDSTPHAFGRMAAAIRARLDGWGVDPAEAD